MITGTVCVGRSWLISSLIPIMTVILTDCKTPEILIESVVFGLAYGVLYRLLT